MEDDTKNRSSLFALAIVIVVLFGAGLYSVYSLNGDSLDLRDREVRLVVTGSMDGEPTDHQISTIPINSLVMVRHLSQDELDSIEVGDVIAFDSGGRMIVHRVIDIRSDGYFITKGDANSASDSPVSPSRVIGEVVGVSPLAGKLVVIAKGWTTWIIAFIILLVVVIYSVREILRVYDEEYRNNR